MVEPTPLSVLQVLPRGMDFSHDGASSVELCLADWVAGSAHKSSTRVVAEPGGVKTLVSDSQIIPIRSSKTLSSWHLALAIRRYCRRESVQIIAVQQHLATAARIAILNPQVPIVLQTHNFFDHSLSMTRGPMRHGDAMKALRHLAGVTFISHATQQAFRDAYPDFAGEQAVVQNVFDLSTWRHDLPKRREIAFMGRCTPEKGVEEAALGVAAALADRPDWTAAFYLTGVHADPATAQRVRAALAPLGERAFVFEGHPYHSLRQRLETTAIVVVPSRWQEPFGRTAVEAHATGAALISSGTGGLREISGDAALFLDEVSPAAIARQCAYLIDHPAAVAALALAGRRRVEALFDFPRGDSPSSDNVIIRYDRFLARCVR